MNPPGPRKLKAMNGCRKATKQRASPFENGTSAKRTKLNGKPLGRPPMAKIKNLQNGNASQINEMLDESMQLDQKSVIPSTDIVQNGVELEEKSNGIANGSPSIKQKVKYIPQNQFLHIKPPPKDTQKIYVKQQNGINQSYTLGVKNIGTSEVPLLHNKLINVKNNEKIPSPNKINEEIPKIHNTSINSIDIFDIPILFADNDGNIIDENHSQTPKTSTSAQSINSIDIISEEIVNDAIIGEQIFELFCFFFLN